MFKNRYYRFRDGNHLRVSVTFGGSVFIAPGEVFDEGGGTGAFACGAIGPATRRRDGSRLGLPSKLSLISQSTKRRRAGRGARDDGGIVIDHRDHRYEEAAGFESSANLREARAVQMRS